MMLVRTQDLDTDRAPKPAAPEFDEDGFLLNPLHWNRSLATQLAAKEGIGPLTEDHWKIIEHIRLQYHRCGGLPVMRQVCRKLGLSREDMQRLVSSCLSLWRIAGLPNPGEEAKSYMS